MDAIHDTLTELRVRVNRLEDDISNLKRTLQLIVSIASTIVKEQLNKDKTSEILIDFPALY
jgi:hypothetical protein